MNTTHSVSYLNGDVPSLSRANQLHKRALSKSFQFAWDRVKVLGDGNDYGHAGCVNALQWARDGELLLSAGDDTTVQVWRMDPTDTSQEYPFVCRTVIHTGHKANIFNAQMLPYSSRIATVAGDRQVRVFDVGEDHGASSIGKDTRQEHCTLHARTHTLQCHEDRVKRIVTEESPDLFLTVSEDGTVRQHDLRISHSCRSGCPAPILQMHHELSTLALSPLTPYQLVVAGDSPYGYLFDRRYTGRVLQEEWGMVSNGVTNCTRRFGRAGRRKVGRRSYPREHITGARMSSENGHEVLLSYSADAVYLYSTFDDAQSEKSFSSSIISPNVKRRKVSRINESLASPSGTEEQQAPDEMDIDDLMSRLEDDVDENSSQDEDDEEDEDDSWAAQTDETASEESESWYPSVPTIPPRRRFEGARNVDTVKDVNFLGPFDEYVASGSDDGNFFVWHKSTGKLHGIYEGDGTVVNVIESHPKLPLVAVSGIDHTVKLFAPTGAESMFSRTANAQSIIDRNRRRSSLRMIHTIRRFDFITLLASVRASALTNTSDGSADNEARLATDCVNQ